MSISDVSGKLALFPDFAGETAEINKVEGMLPSQEIRKMIANGQIRARYGDISEHQIQPASLDLRLGDVGYRVQASFVPQQSTVEGKIADLGLSMSRVDLTRTTVLEKGCVYIVPLLEEVYLPEQVSAEFQSQEQHRTIRHFYPPYH